MRQDPLTRFVVVKSGCWEWQGWLGREGYGELQINKRSVRAHRLFYETYKSKIPKGLVIDHLCRNRACVNPDHMEPVTIKENILRGFGAPAKNKRKTECVNGHLFSEENTYRTNTGRFCRKCRYANRKKSYHKLKLEIARRRREKKLKEKL